MGVEQRHFWAVGIDYWEVTRETLNSRRTGFGSLAERLQAAGVEDWEMSRETPNRRHRLLGDK